VKNTPKKVGRPSIEPPIKALTRLLFVQSRFKRFERYIVAYPPVKGPQACVIERRSRNSTTFTDAIVILPEKVPNCKISNDAGLSAALALAMTIHRESIAKFMQRKFCMDRVPNSHHNAPYQSKRMMEIRRLGDVALEALSNIRPSDDASMMWLERLGSCLTDLKTEAFNDSWRPWILAEDEMRYHTDLEARWVVAAKWREWRTNTWEEIWQRLFPNEAKLYPVSDPSRTLRINNLRSKCSDIGLKKAS
jgi:hypothetical protein